MEKIAVIYWSGTGNTASMAEEIARGINENGAQADLFTVDAFSGNVSDYEKIAFGCSSMGDEVLEESEFEPFFEKIENSLSGKKITLFGSYGWGDGKWMRDWQERVENRGGNLFSEGLIANGFPDADAKEQCYALGKTFAAY
ncbi:MAG TPA: flavodoxin [Lachnospiraceae bacterium]|nr:flavodoxin [Lachnospiraceae bacterium]